MAVYIYIYISNVNSPQNSTRNKVILQAVQQMPLRSAASGSAMKIPSASPYKLNAR